MYVYMYILCIIYIIYKNRVPAYLTVYRGRLYTLTHINIYIYILYYYNM